MTCIIHGVKLKRELRERVATAEGRRTISIEDPSIFNPRWIDLDDMPVGSRELVTNHPKRSWFASITRISKTEWRVK